MRTIDQFVRQARKNNFRKQAQEDTTIWVVEALGPEDAPDISRSIGAAEAELTELAKAHNAFHEGDDYSYGIQSYAPHSNKMEFWFYSEEDAWNFSSNAGKAMDARPELDILVSSPQEDTIAG